MSSVIPTEVEESLISDFDRLCGPEIVKRCLDFARHDKSVEQTEHYPPLALELANLTPPGQEIRAQFRKAVALSFWRKGSSIR